MSKSSMWSRMASGVAAALFAFGVQAAVDIPRPQMPPAGGAKAPPVQPVDAKKCYSCHEDVEDFHTKGRHATVNCAHCHDNAAEHQKLAKAKDWGVRPNTIKDHRACATCHSDQLRITGYPRASVAVSRPPNQPNPSNTGTSSQAAIQVRWCRSLFRLVSSISIRLALNG